MSSSAILFILLMVIVSITLCHIKVYNLCVTSGSHRPNAKSPTHKYCFLAFDLTGNLTKLNDTWTPETTTSKISIHIYFFWLP